MIRFYDDNFINEKHKIYSTDSEMLVEWCYFRSLIIQYRNTGS